MADFTKGQRVSWDGGHGTIAERFERKVVRRIKDTLVTRYGTPETPAYLIMQDNGSEVLKLGSELTPG